MKKSTRYISLLLSIIMLFGMMPFTALAEDGDDPEEQIVYEEELKEYLEEGGLEIIEAGGAESELSDNQIAVSIDEKKVSRDRMEEVFSSFGGKLSGKDSDGRYVVDFASASKQGGFMSIIQSIIDTILNFFRNLFGGGQTEETFYTVTFNTNGGSAVKSQKIKDGECAVEPSAPKKSGYKFDGWLLNNVKYVFSTPVHSNITLYASWIISDPEEPTVVDSGSCGDNLTWTLYSNGLLIITGTGTMKDFHLTTTPWYDYYTQIKTVMIGNGVTSIGSYAFSNCSNLTGVTIPSSMMSIDNFVFYHCISLTSITVEEGNPAYISIDGILFNKNQTELICYPAGKTQTSYTIPSSVKIIGGRAFYECSSLTSVTIPNSVTNILSSAFKFCTILTDVYYTGTQYQWKNISKGSEIFYPATPTIHCAD